MKNTPPFVRSFWIWLSIATLFIVILSARFLDQPLALWFDDPTRKGLQSFGQQITDIALAVHWFVLSILLYVYSRWIAPQKVNLRRWSAHFFCALAISGVLGDIVKFLVGRERPHMTLGREPWNFAPFSWNWDFQSFPSGHSQAIFCVATAFVLLWPKQKFWIYGVCFLLAFARVVVLAHFFSDVVGGLFVGFAGTALSFYLLQKKVPLPTPLQ